MAYSFTSATNGFIAGFSGGMTEKLIVDYARDYKKCPVVGLADIVTSDVPAGFFPRIKPDPQAQLIDSPNAYLWPDNTTSPDQEDSRRQHEFQEWAAKRYQYSCWIGDLEKQFTAWDIEAQVLNDLGNKAMLNRSKLFYTLVSTAGTYTNAGGTGINHTASATSLGGGTWGAGSSANRYIQKTFAAVLQAIDKATVNGVLPMDDIWCVVSPTVADVMARSQELADGYHRQQDFSEYMQYDLYKNQLARYGLPPKLYGINVLVDPWIERTTKIGATETKSFVAGTNAAYFITKPGGIKSASGGRAFGSVAFFTVKGEEMRTEVVDWPIDRRKKVMVTDMLDCQMVAPAASYLVSATVS
jgi:hypothetical protein